MKIIEKKEILTSLTLSFVVFRWIAIVVVRVSLVCSSPDFNRSVMINSSLSAPSALELCTV